jgi:hypothetical protein
MGQKNHSMGKLVCAIPSHSVGHLKKETRPISLRALVYILQTLEEKKIIASSLK